MKNKKIREYKKILSTISVYDNGIKISSGGSNRFLKKEQIGEVSVGWSGVITIKPLTTGKEMQITLPSEYIVIGEPKILGNFLSGVIELDEFKKHITETDEKIKERREKQKNTSSFKVENNLGKHQKTAFMIALPIIALIVWGTYQWAIPNNIPSQTQQKDLSITAFVISKNFISTALKSPSTADFPFSDFTANNLGGNRYAVNSYVDSQNSFGAMIRNNWQVTLLYMGGEPSDNRSWKLEKMIFGGKTLYPIQ